MQYKKVKGVCRDIVVGCLTMEMTISFSSSSSLASEEAHDTAEGHGRLGSLGPLVQFRRGRKDPDLCAASCYPPFQNTSSHCVLLDAYLRRSGSLVAPVLAGNGGSFGGRRPDPNSDRLWRLKAHLLWRLKVRVGTWDSA